MHCSGAKDALQGGRTGRDRPRRLSVDSTVNPFSEESTFDRPHISEQSTSTAPTFWRVHPTERSSRSERSRSVPAPPSTSAQRACAQGERKRSQRTETKDPPHPPPQLLNPSPIGRRAGGEGRVPGSEVGLYEPSSAPRTPSSDGRRKDRPPAHKNPTPPTISPPKPLQSHPRRTTLQAHPTLARHPAFLYHPTSFVPRLHTGQISHENFNS